MRKQVSVSKENAEAIAGLLGEKVPTGTVLTITAPKNVVGRECACGCKGKTSGGVWVPGHDAKRKSILFAEFRSGDPARKAAAEKELASYDWPVPNAKQDRKPVTPAPAPQA